MLPNRRMVLFDYDELAQGDPLVDLTNFCADLFNQGFADDAVMDCTRLLLSAYQQVSGEIFAPHRIERHWRIQCVTRAYRTCIQQKPGLDEIVDRFLAAAECGVFAAGRTWHLPAGGVANAG